MPKWQMWENKIDKRTNGRRHLRMVPTHGRVKTWKSLLRRTSPRHPSQTFTLYPFSAGAGKRKEKKNYNRETKRREAWDTFFVPRIITVNSLWPNRWGRCSGEGGGEKKSAGRYCMRVTMTKDLWMWTGEGQEIAGFVCLYCLCHHFIWR